MRALVVGAILALAAPALAAGGELGIRADEDAATAASRRAHVAELVGAPLGPPLAGEALEARTQEVALLLRCPVCQGSAVADSPSDTAQNMRREVKDLLAQGFDGEQVLHYFELSYGEFVRLEPKTDGLGWLVWLGPAAGLLVGAAFVALAVRKLRAERGGDEPAVIAAVAEDVLPEDPELAAYVKKVRAAVAGEESRGG